MYHCSRHKIPEESGRKRGRERERDNLMCLALMMCPTLQLGERMSLWFTDLPGKLGQVDFIKGKWVTVAGSTGERERGWRKAPISTPRF